MPFPPTSQHPPALPAGHRSPPPSPARPPHALELHRSRLQLPPPPLRRPAPPREAGKLHAGLGLLGAGTSLPPMIPHVLTNSKAPPPTHSLAVPVGVWKHVWPVYSLASRPMARPTAPIAASAVSLPLMQFKPFLVALPPGSKVEPVQYWPLCHKPVEPRISTGSHGGDGMGNWNMITGQNGD